MKNLKILVLLLLTGCAVSGVNEQHRIVLEKSSRESAMPGWISDSQVTWLKADKVFYKSQYSVRGDQRVNACFDLVKAEAKEKLVDEIRSNFKSETNGYTQGAGEIDNQELNKMFVSSVNSIISGFRLSESAYERYSINNNERIDCFVLYEMSLKDLTDLKLRMQSNKSNVNKEIQQAIIDRGVSFLTNTKATE